jgi:hypothetical protein
MQDVWAQAHIQTQCVLVPKPCLTDRICFSNARARFACPCFDPAMGGWDVSSDSGSSCSKSKRSRSRSIRRSVARSTPSPSPSRSDRVGRLDMTVPIEEPAPIAGLYWQKPLWNAGADARQRLPRRQVCPIQWEMLCAGSGSEYHIAEARARTLHVALCAAHVVMQLMFCYCLSKGDRSVPILAALSIGVLVIVSKF